VGLLSPPFLARGCIPREASEDDRPMVPPQKRPKAKSPAERAEEFAAVQRQLKLEAAERRGKPSGKPTAAGMSRHSRPPARLRRTP